MTSRPEETKRRSALIAWLQNAGRQRWSHRDRLRNDPRPIKGPPHRPHLRGGASGDSPRVSLDCAIRAQYSSCGVEHRTGSQRPLQLQGQMRHVRLHLPQSSGAICEQRHYIPASSHRHFPFVARTDQLPSGYRRTCFWLWFAALLRSDREVVVGGVFVGRSTRPRPCPSINSPASSSTTPASTRSAEVALPDAGLGSPLDFVHRRAVWEHLGQASKSLGKPGTRS